MSKLIIPSNPSRIEACTPRAWMRLRIHDQPVIGMLVGTKDRELLLYVGKNGVLEQAPIGYSNMKFIDYLTQDESVTIYGEAAQRTEDDIAEMEAPQLPTARPDLVTGTNRTEVPDFMPYVMSGFNLTQDGWHVVNFPTTDGRRVGMCFNAQDPRNKAYCSLRGDGSERNVFLRFIDEPLDRWRTHTLLREYNVVDPSTWPTI